MSNQLFEDGKVIIVDDVELECVAVSHQEDPETQERHTFGYTFRPKAEVEAEREVARKADEEAEAARKLAEETREATELPPPAENIEANSTEPGSVENAPGDQPEEPKEETQYVK